MRPQHILKTRNRSMTLVVALGTAAALVTGGGAGALASSATISRMGGHNTALQGTVAHAIIEFFPAVPEAHTWHQSWTDAADGLDKEVITDGRGRLVTVITRMRRADGSFVISTVYNAPTMARQTRVVRPLLSNGHVPEYFWSAGHSSLTAMRAIYAGYVRQAGRKVTRETHQGIVLRRFDMRSADRLVGTIWLNPDGLPVQEESGHNPQALARYLTLEQLPASGFTRGFWVNPPELSARGLAR